MALLIIAGSFSIADQQQPDYHKPNVVTKVANECTPYITQLKWGMGRLGRGSGVLISPNLVLTNWHVVVGAVRRHEGVLGDQVRLDWAPANPLAGNANATVVYAAPYFDMAIVLLHSPTYRTPVVLNEMYTSALLRLADKQRVRIYPVGFTPRSEADLFHRLGLGLKRHIDTGEITDFKERDIESWLAPQIDENIANDLKRLLGSSRLRPRPEPEGKPVMVGSLVSNAWITGGQSGGPCLDEDGKLIAINDASSLGTRNAEEVYREWGYYPSIHLPAELVRLFLVGVDDFGNFIKPVFDRFQKSHRKEEVGLPYYWTDNILVHGWKEGRVQTMKNANGQTGAIMLKEAENTAYWVHGANWAFYANNGGPRKFGYPRGEEHEIRNQYGVTRGAAQEFEKAILVWDAQTDTVKVVSKVAHPPGDKWPFDPILVIDRSGSIQGVSGLTQVIEGDAVTFVDKLLQRARKVAVINFSSRGEVHLDCRFSSNRARVLQAINNPSVTSGGTALYQAVDEALNTSPAGGKTAVIVFSDGCENSSMISLEEAIRKAQERGVPVLTVGYIGDGGRNEDGLKQLAGSTHGFYERAEALDVDKMLNRFSDYLEYKKAIAPVGGAF